MGKRQLSEVSIVALALFGFGEIALLFFTPRTETTQLLVLYFALFAAYIALCNEIRNIRTLAFIGVVVRCVAWLALPSLSDDIYRFVWDGSVILEGVNPYLQTPSTFLIEHSQKPFTTLFPLLNSQDYFSVYPLIIQMISAFGALASNDIYLATLIIKLPILIAEIGTIWLLPNLLMQLRINPKYSSWYFLNPLIIIELCGNAHFEGVMIFFVICSIKLILTKRFYCAAIALALGVATKLMPIFLFPFLLKVVPNRFRFGFCLSFVFACALLFFPFFHPVFISHFLSSIDLYFRSFEFNASVYYLVRTIGYWVTGYNQIQLIGPSLLLLSVIIGIGVWIKQKSLSLNHALTAGLISITSFYFLATTVHPWYISLVLILGILNERLFPILWSGAIFLSYSAYKTSDYQEDYWLIALEYGLVLTAMLIPKYFRRWLL